MDERIYLLSTELALYGEIFLRFFVNRYDGTLKLRFIDPSLIDLIGSSQLVSEIRDLLQMNDEVFVLGKNDRPGTWNNQD